MTGFDQRGQQVSGNQYNAEKIFFQQSDEEAGDHLNRQRMIERVRSIWITGFLEQPLLDEPSLKVPRIQLELHSCPGVLANPWHSSVQEMRRSRSSPFPQGTSLPDIYKQAAGALLLLGDPGVGKTTLLLELARDLLERAEADGTQPIPVVFHLNEWAQKRLPLADWLIEELAQKYQVQKLVGRPWVEQDQLLLLLDGFDEVKEKYREACLDAIEKYRSSHGLVPLVVCSRTAEYMEQKKRLPFRLAVTIQPLSRQQASACLQTGGKPLAAASLALEQDPLLRELVTTPLMLHIYMQAYYGESVEEGVLTGSVESRRQQMIATYVKRMFERRGKLKTIPPEQMKRWLSWLAAVMKQRQLTEFYLEFLQPNWLVDQYARWLYKVGAILAFLLIGALMGLIAVWITPSLTTASTFSIILGTLLGTLYARLCFSISFGPSEQSRAPIGTIVLIEKVSLSRKN